MENVLTNFAEKSHVLDVLNAGGTLGRWPQVRGIFRGGIVLESQQILFLLCSE